MFIKLKPTSFYKKIDKHSNKGENEGKFEEK